MNAKERQQRLGARADARGSAFALLAGDAARARIGALHREALVDPELDQRPQDVADEDRDRGVDRGTEHGAAALGLQQAAHPERPRFQRQQHGHETERDARAGADAGHQAVERAALGRLLLAGGGGQGAAQRGHVVSDIGDREQAEEGADRRGRPGIAPEREVGSPVVPQRDQQQGDHDAGAAGAGERAPGHHQQHDRARERPADEFQQHRELELEPVQHEDAAGHGTAHEKRSDQRVGPRPRRGEQASRRPEGLTEHADQRERHRQHAHRIAELEEHEREQDRREEEDAERHQLEAERGAAPEPLRARRRLCRRRGPVARGPDAPPQQPLGGARERVHRRHQRQRAPQRGQAVQVRHQRQHALGLGVDLRGGREDLGEPRRQRLGPVADQHQDLADHVLDVGGGRRGLCARRRGGQRRQRRQRRREPGRRDARAPMR
jgi:hypothetical protein